MTLTDAFKDRRVFVTGHTGFKGSWLSIWLARLGAVVTGYSLDPPGSPSNFASSRVATLIARHYRADIRESGRLERAIAECEPDVIFHLAAQPLVRRSYRQPSLTFEVNILGTLNVLEIVRRLGRPCVVVIVTSDKCYAESDDHSARCETDRLGGRDPYSASKASAEIVTAAYRDSYFPPSELQQHHVKIASVRAGNVIGGGDWAEDRLVPDMVRAAISGQPLDIRNAAAIRPWQHVLEPLSGYLTLASRMLESDDPELCSGWNFGPPDEHAWRVADLADGFCRHWPGMTWRNTNSHAQPYESPALRLSITRASQCLGWQPRWSLSEAVARTCVWYRAFYDNPDASTYGQCVADLIEFDSSIAGDPFREHETIPFANAR